MTPPPSGEGQNPFELLFGDLMKLLGSQGSHQWETTRAFAVQVATGGEPEGNVDPVQRIQVEELARVAELHVSEATGMPIAPDGRRLSCVPVGRADWALRALDAWQPVLTAMTPAATAPGAMPDTSALEPSGEPGDALVNLLGQWAGMMGPMFFGLQVGSVVGHLSQRALGQYVLPVPWPVNDELLVVPANIASFASDWSLPEEEALVWVCARELASHSVLARPSVRAHIDRLLKAFAASASTAQQGLMDRLSSMGDELDLPGVGGEPMDIAALQGMLGNPEALLGSLLTPDVRRTSDQLTAIAIVVDAYADHVADLVGRHLVGAHAALAEAWYRRRIERGKGEEAAGALFGLDLDQVQVDRGRAFVAGVIERAGEEQLGRLWTSERTLPTPAEVDAPGLWLERIDLPELDPPSAASGDAPEA